MIQASYFLSDPASPPPSLDIHLLPSPLLFRLTLLSRVSFGQDGTPPGVEARQPLCVSSCLLMNPPFFLLFVLRLGRTSRPPTAESDDKK